jgi:AhpD family alkylhydroperoxidase
MQPRIPNPVMSIPGVFDAMNALGKAAKGAGVPEETLVFVALRASQINGCSMCTDIHTRELAYHGVSAERIHMLAAWREAPYYSDAERAALALAEAATRLADRADPVPDEVWDEAARHYSEDQLAALILALATINAYNRLNAATRQLAGPAADQIARALVPQAA